MFTFKYYDDFEAIRTAQKEIRREAGGSHFDFEQLGAGRWRDKVIQRGISFALRVSRAVWPIVRIGRFAAISRAADVTDVLGRPDTFQVVYGLEMIELAGGENFVLGIDAVDLHKAQDSIISKVMPREDAARFAKSSRRFAHALLDASGGRIDVMKDLITRVASETCIEYFGLRVDDPDSFAEWTMSISSLIFADPTGKPATRRLALEGAARVRAVIDRSIAIIESQQASAPPKPPETLLERLLDEGHRNPDLTKAKIKAILVGVLTGLIPTNTLAAGKILEELLRRPDALKKAIEAARCSEDVDEKENGAANPHRGELERILFEAARLNPALAPGQWRYARKDAMIGTTPIAKGTVLLVSTMSGLRDKTAVPRPDEFDPTREPAGIGMMFGEGLHECLGIHLAMAQITAIFQVLLAQDELRVARDRCGKIQWIGPFPRRLDMEFEPKARIATQAMLTICGPLRSDSSKDDVRQLIEDLERKGELKKSLDATGIVHFASLSVIEAGDDKESKPYLLLELNVDGTRDAAIQTVAAHTQDQLGKIFDHTPPDGSTLAEKFATYALDLETRPWGATGLNFNGTPEFAVDDIEMQDRLAKFARKALDFYIGLKFGIGSRALPTVRFIRGLIRQDQSCLDVTEDEAAKAKIKLLMTEGKQFSDDLIIPSRRQLQIAEWTERTNEEALMHFLKSWDFWKLAIPFVLVAVFMFFGIYLYLGDQPYVWRIPLSLAGGIATAANLLLLLASAYLLMLYLHERSDVPDNRDPKLSDIRTVAARENLPGYAHNHFMAVTQLKPGWFRKTTLALALWGIKQLVTHAYRPGFVLNMGTIHYAKWFRLPKQDKLIFLANYDGSWESYLEDFIMKAHAGQTAAWSNGVGFPRTRLLIYEGAQDGDRFKRWVRRQQVPAQFWYSRFPKLTTDEIRNNAVIHGGLARAHTDTAAMNWLDCFGSMQRPDHAIETDEIQSLMFRGFKRSPCAAYALVKLPDDAAGRANWLEELLPGKIRRDGSREDHVELKSDKPGPTPTQVTFGDYPTRLNERLRNLVTFVAFSASGLKKLGLPSDDDGGLCSFASAFNIGMANRGRILGDRQDPNEPEWRWSDAGRVDEAGNVTSDVEVADAILMVFGEQLMQCTEAVAAHRKVIEDAGGSIIDEVHSEPIKINKPEDLDGFVFQEHFGFRDGISQPVIRGTHRLVQVAPPERDIVEPGEFILGYRNNQGYYPLAISVSAETDFNDRLPDVIAESPSRFPTFRAAHNGSRDFGRNGTFLVVRQIQQHVDKFKDFTKKAAEPLQARVADPEEWVAARMMGRWRNGVPLALRPTSDTGEDNPNANAEPTDLRLSDVPVTNGESECTRSSESRATNAKSECTRVKDPGKDPALKDINDFAYAQDDPQGLRCPLGAHIRRANPRDGLRPGDDLQQAITNRHRLLRRGRIYEIPGQEAEKGMMFTCLCADLERQFEFVQQTWIGSSSFHGLTGEVDPIIGSPDPKKGGVFTIPTPSGPITLDGLQNFVTVRAGGYFFMPSYSSLLYLLDRNRSEAGRRTRRSMAH
jgi:Dyp-type peroxidase family